MRLSIGILGVTWLQLLTTAAGNRHSPLPFLSYDLHQAITSMDAFHVNDEDLTRIQNRQSLSSFAAEMDRL